MDIPLFNLLTVQVSHSRTHNGNSGKDSDGLDVDGLNWDDRTVISLRKEY